MKPRPPSSRFPIVLCFVAAVTEAVLEVEAEVLDWFAVQLRLDPRRYCPGEFGVLAQQPAQPFQTAVRCRRRKRLGAPVGSERRREPVGRDVDGVDGLA